MTTNRACPSCGKDCGQAAENYGHLSGIYQYTNCKACGQRLVSDFAYPSFFWKVANDNIPSDGAQPVAIAQAFKHCCAKFIRDLWASCGGPMNIVNFEGHCPECRRYIGLTQTTEEEAQDFLAQFEMEIYGHKIER